eukprot:TRINITY_DN3930_c0_g1_i1.p1 TRINITY_DN3930_c0_g1~~TRINITY_DN3930_c0_g1_i1.p1  ORF type:complete len:108 (-),score=27.39 TRINITY_DN3930_c0_g1_i1:306-629(-)
MVEQMLGSLISDVNTLKANALVMRKEAEDTEHRSEEIAATCDNLVNQSAAALAVVQAVRWKRKIGTKKRAEDALGAGLESPGADGAGSPAVAEAAAVEAGQAAAAEP